MKVEEIDEIKSTITKCIHTMMDCRKIIDECNDRLISAGYVIYHQNTKYKYSLINNDKFNFMCNEVKESLNVNFQSKNRKQEHVAIRFILMFLLKQTKQHSFPEIGRVFKVDHSTVMHGVQVVKNMISINDQFYIDYLEEIRPIFNKYF